jgi:NadR type nicotinamide-nucleotide adenylyltransferase
MPELFKKIVITGPESTGKTVLAEGLAQRLNAPWIPEFAREYIQKIGRPYTYQDVEIIAYQQVQQEKEFSGQTGQKILILDTWLIITQVWFEVVYGEAPDWIKEYISKADIDLFLVCKTDLPWLPDQVRENGGEMRELLLKLYCKKIKEYGYKFEIVEGFGDERLNCALKQLHQHNIL